MTLPETTAFTATAMAMKSPGIVISSTSWPSDCAQFRSFGDRGRHRLLQFAPGQRGRREADAEFARIASDLIGKWTCGRRRPVRIAELRLAGDVEQHGAVAHAARHGMLLAEAAPALARIRRQRDAAARRLHAEDAATRCGRADRAAAVACMRGGNDACGHRRSRAARRAAGRALEVPGIVRGAEQDRLGRAGQSEFRRVRFAEDDETGAAIGGDERAVAVRLDLGEDARARRLSARPSWARRCPSAGTERRRADHRRRPA